MKMCWNLKNRVFLLSFGVLLVGSAASLPAQLLFFSTGAAVEYCDLDGSNRKALTSVVGEQTSIVDMTVDPIGRQLYWVLYEPARDEAIFWRAAANAKEAEELFRVAAGGDFRSIAVDGQAGKIYWARSKPTDAIQRADLDGTHIETLVQTLGVGLFALVVEPAFNEMYWTSTTKYGRNGTIHRATLDGEDADSLVTREGWPSDFAIDRDAGKIYWADYFYNAVKRADLQDGGNVETLVDGIGHPVGMAIHPVAGKIYWVDTVASKVRWADQDGSNIANLCSVADPGLLGILLEDPVGVSKTSWSDVRQRFR